MKALVYSDWGVLRVMDVPMPLVGEGEVLVRVEACGICGSELETFKSRSPRRTPPLILGHEFCGVIEGPGKPDAQLAKGRKVIANSIISCGKCHSCRRGEENLCSSRQLFGMNRPGAIAEFVAVPAEYVYPCPESLDPVLGALGEPLVNGVHVMNLLPEIHNPTMAIVGAGPLGLLTLEAAIAMRGARVLVADIKEARLEEARKLGAELTINPKSGDLVKSCLEFSGADGVDMCVDAVGAGVTKRQSVKAVRPGGSCCWIGLYENEVKLDTYDITLPEKKVFGSYAGTARDFECAIRLLSEGKVRGGDWLKVFPMDEAIAGFKRMLKAEGNDIKAVVLPGK